MTREQARKIVIGSLAAYGAWNLRRQAWALLVSVFGSKESKR